ncbi:hypothetical protein MAP00_006490 [Monascus purpureus]|nr:hypothetical protein MAP00_006490 [Monascus purpureus]
MVMRYPDTDSDLSDDSLDDNDSSSPTYPPDIYYNPQDSSAFGSARYSRPLIDYVKNEWQTNPKYRHDHPSSENEMPQWARLILLTMAAPKVRRYVPLGLICLLFFWCFWKMFVTPQLEENALLADSLDPELKDVVGGWFGSNSLPKFGDLVKIGTLNPALLPADLAVAGSRRKRLVFVGDVHGCNSELGQLLEKVSFDRENGDHLIFTGDMINKGPDSTGVVDLARKHSASCVRGNHEDRILLVRRAMYAKGELEDNTTEENEEGGNFTGCNSKECKLARQLSNEQARWLERCPVILNIGQIKGMGNVVVVHGGLVPGVENEKQDPSGVMTMRTIDLDNHLPSSSSDGTPWTKLFNKYQSILYSKLKKSSPQNPKAGLTTVIYGHDSASSLQLKTYTKGLDTGCYKGGKLTALIIEDGGKQKIVQVNCGDYKQKLTNMFDPHYDPD